MLNDILSKLPASVRDPNLLVGVETGDDSAVYRINKDQAIVATTDFFMPIVDDPFDFGRIAATNALSDIYAVGGKPILALAIAGFPVNEMSEADIGKVLEGGAKVCTEAGIPIAGGHHPLALGLVLCSLVYVQKKREMPMVIGILLLGFLGGCCETPGGLVCDSFFRLYPFPASFRSSG